MRSLGAGFVADSTREDFAQVLSGYHVVLDSLGPQKRYAARGRSAMRMHDVPPTELRTRLTRKGAAVAMREQEH